VVQGNAHAWPTWTTHMDTIPPANDNAYPCGSPLPSG